MDRYETLILNFEENTTGANVIAAALLVVSDTSTVAVWKSDPDRVNALRKAVADGGEPFAFMIAHEIQGKFSASWGLLPHLEGNAEAHSALKTLSEQMQVHLLATFPLPN